MTRRLISLSLENTNTLSFYAQNLFSNVYLDEEDKADPLVEHVVVPGVDPGVGSPDAGMNVAGMVIKPHVLFLLGCGGPSLMDNKLDFKTDREFLIYRDMLQSLDCVGAVGPAVGVDDAFVDAGAAALDGLPEILLTGQHSREENEERKCGLFKRLDSNNFRSLLCKLPCNGT